VTDEFIGYIRNRGDDWDLDQASGFVVVAATLLDLKVARLLPAGEVDDEEDLALLEARDLLFARLLQYRAYKEVAAVFVQRLADADRRFGRAVALEERFTALLPELVVDITPADLARLAAAAQAPKLPPVVDIGHVHAPTVSVREQAAILASRLRRRGTATFRSLVADCSGTPELVGRFLAVLELYRESAVVFEQVVPLGELHVRWVASEQDAGDVVTADVDDSYRAVTLDD
jgi:segregation and condensation protein A